MAKPYTTRAELNARAYALGFRGKSGGLEGARNGQLAYHKSNDYRARLADIEKLNRDENLGFTKAEMGTAVDASVGTTRRNSDAFMKDYIFYRRVTPEQSLAEQTSQFRQMFANPTALRDFADTFQAEFITAWYHLV